MTTNHKEIITIDNGIELIVYFEYIPHEPSVYEKQILTSPETMPECNITSIQMMHGLPVFYAEMDEVLNNSVIENQIRPKLFDYIAKIQEAILTDNRDYDEQKADFDAACQKKDN